VTDVQRIRNGMSSTSSGRVRIASNLAAGVGYSQFGRAGTGTVTGSIPSPRFFDQPLLRQPNADNLTQPSDDSRPITYFMPVPETFEYFGLGGPSYIHVVQDWPPHSPLRRARKVFRRQRDAVRKLTLG